MTKSFSLQKNRTKWLHYEVVSLINTYIYIYQSTNPVRRMCHNTDLYGTSTSYGEQFEHNQYALLNLSVGNKQNDVVIADPKITKKT